MAQTPRDLKYAIVTEPEAIVFVVDDDPSLRTSTRRLVRSVGFRVQTFASAKEFLDSEFVRDQEERVTRGWRRLQQIPTLGVAIPEYPLPEVVEQWQNRKTGAE